MSIRRWDLSTNRRNE